MSREKIPDPEAAKPEDWDEAAAQRVLDESAEKPVGGWSHMVPSWPTEWSPSLSPL